MRKQRKSKTLPGLLTGLGAASLQTIALRSAMMASGTCSAAEYQRMVREKMMAAMQTSLRMCAWPPASPAALLVPWHSKAKANARRLSRRRRRN
jgi:hypothetical protein